MSPDPFRAARLETGVKLLRFLNDDELEELEQSRAHGHVETRPGYQLAESLLDVGPLARAADHLELALDVIAGPDEHGSR